ncbi:hypothetical protein CPS_0752 [Colwellia psychrerythraea 34H]|uniref:Uncharacterized protein n=1 Tax=Colwellia psychrerythraea (strain 34H / ATCC BAA-681) TaxID=167879 RepID=Q488L3_COLP3|nr:hypothetical protein CPS_0752 [Colwellia psychrerythraea 34H]
MKVMRSVFICRVCSKVCRNITRGSFSNCYYRIMQEAGSQVKQMYILREAYKRRTDRSSKQLINKLIYIIRRLNKIKAIVEYI